MPMTETPTTNSSTNTSTNSSTNSSTNLSNIEDISSEQNTSGIKKSQTWKTGFFIALSYAVITALIKIGTCISDFTWEKLEASIIKVIEGKGAMWCCIGLTMKCVGLSLLVLFVYWAFNYDLELPWPFK